jgi:hypothetical protein
MANACQRYRLDIRDSLSRHAAKRIGQGLGAPVRYAAELEELHGLGGTAGPYFLAEDIDG